MVLVTVFSAVLTIALCYVLMRRLRARDAGATPHGPSLIGHSSKNFEPRVTRPASRFQPRDRRPSLPPADQAPDGLTPLREHLTHLDSYVHDGLSAATVHLMQAARRNQGTSEAA